MRHSPSLLDMVDKQGRTALHYASVCGHAAVVRTLLGLGGKPPYEPCSKIDSLDAPAAPHLLDDSGTTAFEYASHREHQSCLDMFQGRVNEDVIPPSQALQIIRAGTSLLKYPHNSTVLSLFISLVMSHLRRSLTHGLCG